MDDTFEHKTKVVVVANSKCNMKCNHCYLSSVSRRRNPEDTLEVVISLQRKGHEVVIAGGEILLEPDYLKAYKQAGQTYLLTNGLLFKQKPELYGLVQNYGIKQLTFSIHFNIEDRLQSVPELFVVDRIREAKQRGFKVKVTTVVIPENVDSIGTMCGRAVKYGVNILQFDRFVQMGRGEGAEEYVLSDDQVRRFFDHIEEARRRFSKEQLEIRLHGNFGPRPGSRGDCLARENRYCPAGIGLLAIDPYDRVYGCPFAMHKNAIVGHYSNGKIVVKQGLLGNRRDTCIAHLLSSRKERNY